MVNQALPAVHKCQWLADRRQFMLMVGAFRVAS